MCHWLILSHQEYHWDISKDNPMIQIIFEMQMQKNDEKLKQNLSQCCATFLIKSLWFQVQIVGSEKLVRIEHFHQVLIKKGGNCMATFISNNHSPVIFLKSCWQKVKEKDSLGSSLEVGDLLPGTAYTLLLWRENRWLKMFVITIMKIIIEIRIIMKMISISATAKATLSSWLSQHSRSR